jgi:hypothetical protein
VCATGLSLHSTQPGMVVTEVAAWCQVSLSRARALSRALSPSRCCCLRVPCFLSVLLAVNHNVYQRMCFFQIYSGELQRLEVGDMLKSIDGWYMQPPWIPPGYFLSPNVLVLLSRHTCFVSIATS